MHAERVELSEARRTIDSFIVAGTQGADGPIGWQCVVGAGV
jgi:hypothetical protein